MTQAGLTYLPQVQPPAAWRRLLGGPVLPGLILAVAVCMAIGAPWLAPHDPNAVGLLTRFQPPFWLDGGSMAHILGTDDLGRDVLSRLIYGARISIMLAVICVLSDALIGTFLGMVAGYFGGRLDDVLMRLADIMLALPYLLIALVVVSVLGASLVNVVMIIVVLRWAGLARIVRGETLTLRQMDFIALAKVAGVPSGTILRRHILPNVLNSVVVVSTLGVGSVILFESVLSFLGVGVPPPTATWGGIVSDGRAYIASAWWVSFFPGLAITLVCLAANLFGDWLREYLDPKSGSGR